MKTGNEDQHHLSGLRRVALIQADGQLCGLRPLVDRMKEIEKTKVAFGLANRMKKIRITKRFNLMSLGRHAPCLRKGRAGDPTHLSLRARRSGLVHRLIGRYTD